MKIGIIGGGALGLTAAYELVRNGHQVTVIEKETDLGGLVSSYKIGESYFEKFYHHIFGTDKNIIALIKELGLSDKLIWQSGNTGTYYQEKIYPLDSPFTVLKFSPLTIFERLRMGLALGYLKLLGNYSALENITAHTWLKKAMGDNAYKIVWEPLLKGKFQDEYQKITMSWFWARIHSRTPKLGYLKGGFYQLYQKIGEAIKKGGGQINLGEKVVVIEGKSDRVTIKTDKEGYEFDKVLVTLPTSVFYMVTPQITKEFKEKYHWDEYFAAQTLVLKLNKSLTNYYWINISDPYFPFLVCVEHTNLMPESDYDGNTLVYLGNYFSQADPRFGMNENEVLDSYLPFLTKINPDFKKEWVVGSDLFRAPYSQPLVKIGYKDHTPPHETGISNLYLANMAQVYPWDRGQNYSIKLGQEMARLIVGNSK